MHVIARSAAARQSVPISREGAPQYDLGADCHDQRCGADLAMTANTRPHRDSAAAVGGIRRREQAPALRKTIGPVAGARSNIVSPSVICLQQMTPPSSEGGFESVQITKSLVGARHNFHLCLPKSWRGAPGCDIIALQNHTNMSTERTLTHGQNIILRCGESLHNPG